MAVTVEKTALEPWGNCIRISNGATELFATVDIGPHIIRLAVNGKHNMFFEDKEGNMVNKLENSPFEGDEWRIFGGHRLWVSPEADPYSYYPEIHPVDYTLLENGVILRQKPQEFNNLALEMTVTMDEDGTVTVQHKVTNIGAWTVELAPWAMSVLAPGGVEVVPQPDRDTGLLGNRVMALWPYTDMSDPRVTWGRDYIVLRQDPTNENKFKYGLNGEKGCAFYFLKGALLVKKFAHVMGAEYPDGGMSFETFTNKYMLEMESLGALTKIASGASVYHTETFNVYDNVELPELTDEEIGKVVKKYM